MKPDQLSNTAAFLAVKFYGLTRDETYRAFFEEEIIQFYDKLIESLPAPIRYYHRGLDSKALRRFFIFWEELLLPGDLMHIILRKWYLTKWVDALRKSGYEQLLVPGAGFDHLAAFNAAEGVYSVEIEAPRMAGVKRKFLNQNCYYHPELHIADGLLGRDSFAHILSQKTDLDPTKKTIVVAEGFFDYLTQHNTAKCLEVLHSFFDNDVVLLSTLFALEELPTIRSFVYRNSIRLASEQLQLGLGREEYLSLLDTHGFEPQQIISSSEMKKNVLRPREVSLPVLEGFYLIKTHRSAV